MTCSELNMKYIAYTEEPQKSKDISDKIEKSGSSAQVIWE